MTNIIFKSESRNLSLILLIISAVVNDLILRALTVKNIFFIKPIVTSISMVLLISLFTCFMSYKNRNRVYIALSIYFGLLNCFNYLYYKHYNSFISITLLNQLKQVKEISDSVTKTVDFKIFIFIIPTIIFIYILKKINRNFINKEIQNKSIKKEFLRPLFIGTILLTLVSLTLTSTDWSRIRKQWNRPYLVEQLGIYAYTIADITKSLSIKNISIYESEEAFTKFEEYIDENIDKKSENDYTDIFKGKDLYVIHYESAQRFAMNLKFEDGYVTPFLNKLASEGIYFDNFYPQHSVGTSSDSEFTFNTSLLPINNGTVFLSHFDREYVTLPKLLKNEGYYTVSMHGNNGDFWNRNIMHKSLGYDRFFSEKDYVIDEVIGLGISDKSFFKQSIEKIKQIKEEQQKPIMATLITLSNHYPFNDVENYGEFNVGHLEGTDIGNYLKSFHYADTALESFIKGMDEAGLLDNAVIVLYGDHHAKISTKDYGKLFNYDEQTNSYFDKDDDNYYKLSKIDKKKLKRTPFIIWSKDKKFNTKVDIPMGMIDALPTISNMFGIYNQYQLGKDMMSIDENLIVFPNGDWLDNNLYFETASLKLYSLKNNEILDDSIIKDINNKTEKIIELSNSIIQHDLIRYYNGFLVRKKKLREQKEKEIHNKLNI